MPNQRVDKMFVFMYYLIFIHSSENPIVGACNSVSESEMRAALMETVSVMSVKMDTAIEEALANHETPEKAVFTHAHVSKNYLYLRGIFKLKK